MLRIVEDVVDRPVIDDDALVEHGDARGDVPRKREVVRDEEQRQAELVAELLAIVPAPAACPDFS